MYKLTSSPILPREKTIFPTGIFGTGSLLSSPIRYQNGSPFFGTALAGLGTESITFLRSVGFLKVISVIVMSVMSSRDIWDSFFLGGRNGISGGGISDGISLESKKLSSLSNMIKIFNKLYNNS